MKKVILFLFTVMLVVTGISQTNTPVILRTLGLTSDFAVTDTWIVNEQIERTIEVHKYVNEFDYLKKEKINGKWVYTYPAPVYTYSIVEKRSPAKARTCLPNYVAMRAQSSAVKFNGLSLIKDVQPNVVGGWIGASVFTVSTDGSTCEDIVSLGYSNNVIPKKYSGGVYLQPVDCNGTPIGGKDVPNQGAPSTSWETDYNNPPVTIQFYLDRKMKDGREYFAPKPTRTYMLKNDLVKALNTTDEQLSYELRTTHINQRASPVTHVTSTSAEIMQIGNSCRLILYVNGYDVTQVSPKNRITPYGQLYPTTNPQIRLFNGATSGAYGTTLDKVLAADGVFTLQAGSAPSFNGNTLTYNSNIPAELWGIGFVANNNGKQFNMGECFYKIQSGQLVSKKD